MIKGAVIMTLDSIQEIINNENLVWGKPLENESKKFFCKLSEDVINELNQNISNDNFLNMEFSLLEKEIGKMKNTYLNNGVGFFIIDGTSFLHFSKSEIKKIYEKICKCLGILYEQNIKKEKFVEIKDSGKSMKTGGRYHQTKEGGSYHTDSPQWENVPDYVGLYCVSRAKIGGESKFVSAYKIHNDLLKNNEDYLRLLYEKFHFDKRGEIKDNESKTVFEPIFKIVKNELRCRYLRNYINDGHDISKEGLTDEQVIALNNFDKFSMKDENVVSYNLETNDILFFNNHRILHGRSSFEDYDEEERKRLMIRTWIKDPELY